MPDNKLPEVDLKKWGDRILGGPNGALPAPDMNVIRQAEEKPIAIQVAGYDVARLFADHTGPYLFAQFLLERFKAAGAPVEGVPSVKLRLHHGKIFKLRSQPGDASFRYIWLPEEHATALGVQGREGTLVH